MVQVSDPQQRRWGFQLSARLKSDPANGQAGDFKPSDGFTQVICDSGALKPCCNDAMVQFIEHTLAGTRRGTPGGATFEFDWTPPSTDSGNIVLYVAGNAANGDATLSVTIFIRRVLNSQAASLITPPAAPPVIPVSKYAVHNLVSDVPGLVRAQRGHAVDGRVLDARV
jgi:hypothetical protein